MKNSPYWRSFEELANTEEFRKLAEDEFPYRTPDWNDPASRRRFLALMGASIGLAGGLAGCTKQPKEVIVPYVRQPEEVIPGVPLFYATAMSVAGIATGVLAESHLGRPTKIEGNPTHPASLGATDPAMQASVLTVYDPDRSQAVMRNGYISEWGNFVDAVGEMRGRISRNKGAGLRILSGTMTSPTLAAQIQEFQKAFPEAKWHQWEACGRHSVQESARASLGKPINTLYRFDRANVIVSLDGDFLCSEMPGALRYAHDYTGRRRAAAANPGNAAPRLYVAEGTPSLAGGMAEHRFRMRTGEVESFAVALAQALEQPVEGPAMQASFIPAVAKDLAGNRGSSLIVPGEYQPARVHAIAHALNQALGNVGNTVLYTDPVEIDPIDQVQSIRELVTDMRDGKVQDLLILGGNPVYDAPADLQFLKALQQVKNRMYLGLYSNETAAWCHWHVPEAHYLESWSDARAYDGTVSIVQPLIAPIYSGKTVHEVMNVLMNRADRTSHETVQDYWRMQHTGKDFDDFWQVSLNDGIVAGTAFPQVPAPPVKIPPSEGPAAEALEIVFRPDPIIGAGALSNNAWLQETPKPQSKMTWDNAVWISPSSATHYNLAEGDVIEIDYRGERVRGPVWIMAAHADESITVQFGYGRTRAGSVGNGVGFDAYALRTSDALWRGMGVAFTRISRGYAFATPQRAQTMEERDPFRVATYAEYHRDPTFASPPDRQVPNNESLFPLWPYKQHKWGMAIDLTACVGCQACTVACQAENNIPVVGKEQVEKGRHMNWLRVDRYFRGGVENPDYYFQPVPCMQCEDAPCELVCPVAATLHSGEGLNEMVYNRCVGTRYCSNNCPYKVRRFNFLLYSDWNTQSLYGVRNPDVTVRSRGVMEKCTYCVQRISEAKITAEKENRPLRDGEIVTACQQSCPTEAIVFGDLNDPTSRVVRLKKQQRDYNLLEDLNTRPRTSYLARLRNPNPEIEKS